MEIRDRDLIACGSYANLGRSPARFGCSHPTNEILRRASCARSGPRSACRDPRAVRPPDLLGRSGPVPSSRCRATDDHGPPERFRGAQRSTHHRGAACTVPRRLDSRRVAGAEPVAGDLEDPQAALEEDTPHPLARRPDTRWRRPSGRGRRGTREMRPLRSSRRGTWKCWLTPRRSAVIRSSAHRPTAPRRRHDVLPIGAVPGIDPLIAGEAADRLDALLTRLAERDRGSITEVVREVLQVAPERVHEPTVAAARAAADEVLLDDRDVDPGIELLQMERAPHPRVAAAEDHDIGREVSSQRRSGLARVVGQCLSQPPATAGVGGNGGHGRFILLARLKLRIFAVPHGGTHMEREHDRPRSWEVTEGAHARRSRDAPRRRVLEDDIQQAAGRRRVVVERGTPCNYHPASSPPSRRMGVRQGGSGPVESGRSRLRRDREGTRGDERLR